MIIGMRQLFTDGGEPKWERSRSVGGCYSIVDCRLSIRSRPLLERESRYRQHPGIFILRGLDYLDDGPEALDPAPIKSNEASSILVLWYSNGHRAAL